MKRTAYGAGYAFLASRNADLENWISAALRRYDAVCAAGPGSGGDPHSFYDGDGFCDVKEAYQDYGFGSLG